MCPVGGWVSSQDRGPGRGHVRDPPGHRVAELLVGVLGEVEAVGEVVELEVGVATYGTPYALERPASSSSTRGTAWARDGADAGPTTTTCCPARAAIRSRKPRSMASPAGRRRGGALDHDELGSGVRAVDARSAKRRDRTCSRGR